MTEKENPNNPEIFSPLLVVPVKMADGTSQWVSIEGWDPDMRFCWGGVISYKNIKLLLAFDGRNLLFFLYDAELNRYQYFNEAWFTDDAVQDDLMLHFNTEDIQGIVFKVPPGLLKAADDAELVPERKKS